MTGRKTKLFNSRTIRTETADPALKDGVLRVPDFLAAREFEIRALEQSQLNTKHAASTRVFQALPRTLRRRTASHNVKRIPKRLRARALREMRSSAGPNLAKNEAKTVGLGKPPKRITGRERYRMKLAKRLLRVAAKIKAALGVPAPGEGTVRAQIKTLNAQLRAAKPTTNNKLAAVDLSGNDKLASRPIGGRYAKRQRQFVWVPNHVWHAKRFHMMKRWGYQIPLLPNQKCFRATTRAAKHAAIASDTSYYSELVVHCPTEAQVKAFLNEYTRYSVQLPPWLLGGQKVYNGWVYVDGQRRCPGTVFTGPSPNKNDSLTSVYVRVHPVVYEEVFSSVAKWAQSHKEASVAPSVDDCRYALGSLELRGPLALPSLGKILHMDASPAWQCAAHTQDNSVFPPGTLFTFMAKDPRYWKQPVEPPRGQALLSAVLSGEARTVDPAAAQALLTPRGRTLSYRDMYTNKQLGREFLRRLPASRHVHGHSQLPLAVYKQANGAWCVVAPWHWVKPLWTMLVRVHSVKTGGLRQHHQVNFEHGIPTFPHDYVFTPEGFAELQLVARATAAARNKLPRSKQAPVLSTEGVLGPCADWTFLKKFRFGLLLCGTEPAQPFGEFDAIKRRVLRNTDDLALAAAAAVPDGTVPVAEFRSADPVHQSIVAGTYKPDATQFPPLPVLVVYLSLDRGWVRDHARIYEKVPEPKLEHLIGYVTSGAFNMHLGHASGLGLVAATHRLETKVLVRNVGCTTFMPATMHIQKT